MGFSHPAARCNNLISRTLLFSLALSLPFFLSSYAFRPPSVHPSATAATASTAAAAAVASFFILTSRALPPRPLELPPTLHRPPVYAETRRSQSDVRRFARPARTIVSRFFYLMQSLVGFRRQALPSPPCSAIRSLRFPSSAIPSLRRSPRRAPTDPLPSFAILFFCAVLFFLLSLLYSFFFSLCLGAIVSAY